jgi:hypothetical protein
MKILILDVEKYPINIMLKTKAAIKKKLLEL